MASAGIRLSAAGQAGEWQVQRRARVQRVAHCAQQGPPLPGLEGDRTQINRGLNQSAVTQQPVVHPLLIEQGIEQLRVQHQGRATRRIAILGH